MTYDPSVDANCVYLTKEELDARIAYCDEMAAEKDYNPLTGEKDLPGEWSAQYAARSLYLTSQYEEQWYDYLEASDTPNKVFVEEMDYIPYIESLCEDYAYADVYENGTNSLYAWMVWALHHECYEWDCAIIQYADQMGWDCPTWMDREDWNDAHEEM